jgi:hypothetical protein
MSAMKAQRQKSINTCTSWEAMRSHSMNQQSTIFTVSNVPTSDDGNIVPWYDGSLRFAQDRSTVCCPKFQMGTTIKCEKVLISL